MSNLKFADQPLRALSSMATKALLKDLCAEFVQQSGMALELESTGGVDAAKRVAAGEPVDLVLLASDAIDRLMNAGQVLAQSRGDWVLSSIAMAVPSDQPTPDIHDEASLRVAVQRATRIAYSTGPSGNYLELLFERWGLTAEVKAKLVVPPPGVPVGSLIASGEVTLGFQQRSELVSLKGIHLLGDLPADVAHTTIFSSALGLHLSQSPERQQAVRQWQTFLMSDATAQVKLRHGMRALSHSA
ncbi:MAG: hypothetical protein RL307_1080 [Pseudomonadota bacterium]